MSNKSLSFEIMIVAVENVIKMCYSSTENLDVICFNQMEIELN
jgi:hypothetical protein